MTKILKNSIFKLSKILLFGVIILDLTACRPKPAQLAQSGSSVKVDDDDADTDTASSVGATITAIVTESKDPRAPTEDRLEIDFSKFELVPNSRVSLAMESYTVQPSEMVAYNDGKGQSWNLLLDKDKDGPTYVVEFVKLEKTTSDDDDTDTGDDDDDTDTGDDDDDDDTDTGDDDDDDDTDTGDDDDDTNSDTGEDDAAKKKKEFLALTAEQPSLSLTTEKPSVGRLKFDQIKVKKVEPKTTR